MWTDERIEKLKVLWNEGRSASECAILIGGGFSRSAIIGKVHRIGLPKRKAGRRVDVKQQRASVARMRTLKPKRHTASMRTAVNELLLRDLPTEPLPHVDDISPTLSWANLENTTDVITQCRAILPADGDKTICGRKTVVGTSWCECHLRRYATPIAVAKAKQPDRPSWQDNRAGRKGAVFLGGREKMKAY